MLEVVNLTKIYKSKGGVEVRALDGVTLKFPEKGMVFLLGKSGSGKSTLLNVCGGLDSPTNGEIIVKGRSSKDFSQSDFDSYRNTFIGFIFQEYNILNEFSVEDNIALALELQGKKKDKEAINALLEQVDLVGYAKRKPNTLSGGQKQRIAIARALVKSPEIIMADEPTGALDSNTGKQVFDTLKKLSKDKLVIVVSHDRDFAETYGDRIIELKDGQILTDETKSYEERVQVSTNVNDLGDTLCVKAGDNLTDSDFEEIKKFLKNNNGDLIIASGQKDVSNFKQVARITDDGQKEVFKNTDESTYEKKEWTKEDGKFIRSKLPAKHAFKIGVSGLKNKPIRLFFTILLCLVAFILFGITSTLTFYKTESTFKQTLKDGDFGYIKIDGTYRGTQTHYENGEISDSWSMDSDIYFGIDDLSKYIGDLENNAFGVNTREWDIDSINTVNSTAPYYCNEIFGYGYLQEGHPLRNINYPTASDEVMISGYLADVIVAKQVYVNGSTSNFNNREDLIGATISFGNNQYKIVSIFDSGEIPHKFEELKQTDSKNTSLERDFEDYLKESIHSVIFISRQAMLTFNNISNSNEDELAYYRKLTIDADNTGVNLTDLGTTYYFNENNIIENKNFFDTSKTTLTDNEILINVYDLKDIAYSLFYEKYSNYYTLYNLTDSSDPNYNEYEQLYKKYYSLYQQCDHFNDTTSRNNVIDQFKNENLSFSVRVLNNDYSPIGATINLNVVGYTDFSSNYGSTTFIVNANTYNTLWDSQKIYLTYYENETNFVSDINACFNKIYLKFDKSNEQIETLWQIYDSSYNELDFKLNITNEKIKALSNVDTMISSLSKAFTIIGVILAVFAVLLFSNFISVSISNKKREIGILRAVGARSIDVFKIFFSESFVIAFICLVLSIIGSLLLCNVMNAEFGADLGASIFVFGLPSILILVGIAILTAIISTFIPVFKAARKKPVESIRSL